MLTRLALGLGGWCRPRGRRRRWPSSEISFAATGLQRHGDGFLNKLSSSLADRSSGSEYSLSCDHRPLNFVTSVAIFGSRIRFLP